MPHPMREIVEDWFLNYQNHHKDVARYLVSCAEYMKEADDCGTVDFTMGRLQELFASIPKILDENGGI